VLGHLVDLYLVEKIQQQRCPDLAVHLPDQPLSLMHTDLGLI